MKKLVIASAVLTSTFVITMSAHSEGNVWFNQSALNDPERPYLYYPDEQTQNKSSALPQTGTQAQVAIEQLQQSLKLSKSLALMNPTEEHVRDYIEKQEQVMNYASAFTDQWRRVLWKNPSLDYSQTHRPTNNAAAKVYDQEQDARRANLLTQFAQSYGLMLFVRSDCSYCHAFAPILKAFQNKYGFRVMTVSLDGGGVPGFENALPDNGISQKLGVEVTPSLFIADTYNRQYLPISTGMVSIQDLETRFTAIASPVGSAF